ncbi:MULTISPECIES: DUF397 domain-containing protein [unclassified Streptomyces]|uniref:DUF397 domain-containing protein n=1 Tax=Streptomyces sp. NBC_00060 TaxID=2975636 RepID=A0AAU2H133_9ACTN
MSTEQLHWFKSSYSSGEGGACIEIATHPSAIHIRDSKNNRTGGPEITVLPSAWAAFVSYATR